VCVDAISVELACQICKYNLSEERRKMLIKRSGQNSHMYQQTLVKVRTSLGIKITVSMRDVALKFGLQSLLPFANLILSQYKKRTREQIGAIQSQFLKFDNPSFQAAALTLAASKRKVHVNAERLVNAVGTTIIEYRRIRNSMLETCSDLVSTTTTITKTTTTTTTKATTLKSSEKKKRKRNEDKTTPEEVIPGYENTNEAAERRAKAAEEEANREYLEWKKSVTTKKKEDVDLSKSKKRKKQSNILAAFGCTTTTPTTTSNNNKNDEEDGSSTKEDENLPNKGNNRTKKAIDLDSLLAASFS